ncbi:MAG: GAF domain-containing protein, partial [Proteobacteria bacterium]
MKRVNAQEEERRLEILRGTQLLDSTPEESYDRIAQLAAFVCEAPISFVSLVDKDRIWFKAKVGVDICSADRSESFCTHVVESHTEIFEVEDALKDVRFRDNPYVTGPLAIRSYTGVPIIYGED